MTAKHMPGKLHAAHLLFNGEKVTGKRIRDVVAEHPEIRVFIVQDYHPSARIKKALSDDLVQLRRDGITHHGVETDSGHLREVADSIKDMGAAERHEEAKLFYTFVGDNASVLRAHLITAMEKGRTAQTPALTAVDFPTVSKRSVLDIGEREQHLYNSITEILAQDEGNRIILLIGADHVRNDTVTYSQNTKFREPPPVPTVTSRLLQAGINVVTITFPGNQGRKHESGQVQGDDRIQTFLVILK